MSCVGLVYDSSTTCFPDLAQSHNWTDVSGLLVNTCLQLIACAIDKYQQSHLRTSSLASASSQWWSSSSSSSSASSSSSNHYHRHLASCSSPNLVWYSFNTTDIHNKLSFGVPSPKTHDSKLRYQHDSSCVHDVDATFGFPTLRFNEK